MRWTTQITDWNPPHSFTDIQLSGPYSLWRHQHRFAADRNGTLIQDAVSYALPLGPLGRLAHWMLVRRDVERIFGYRAEKMRELFGAPLAIPLPSSETDQCIHAPSHNGHYGYAAWFV